MKQRAVIITEWNAEKSKGLQLKGLTFWQKLKFCIGVFLEQRVNFIPTGKVIYNFEYIKEKVKRR